MSDKLMELIDDLRQSGDDLAEFWRERSNFWFERHREKDRMYWQEREKRLTAEYLLEEFENAR